MQFIMVTKRYKDTTVILLVSGNRSVAPTPTVYRLRNVDSHSSFVLTINTILTRVIILIYIIIKPYMGT